MPSPLAQSEHSAALAAIAGLACAGPNYSSYPSAEQFGTRFRAGDALRELRRRGEEAAARPLAIDIHPPLRDAPPRAEADPAVHERYLDCVEREIITRRGAIGRDEVVAQVRFGAGAPVPLATDAVARLLDSLRGYFVLAPEGDYAIEVEAHCASARVLKAFAALGFNAVRLITGEGRADGLALAGTAVGRARDAGFARVELEWLGALRTGSSGAAALEAMLTLGPAAVTIDAARDPETLAATLRTLAGAGYRCVAMDRFAPRTDGPSRIGPDGTVGDVLAFGAAAVSAMGETYSQNHARVADYCDSLDRGELPVWRGHALDGDELARREVIGALAREFAVDLEAFALRFGTDFSRCFAREAARLEALERDGLLARDATSLRVPEFARPLVRVACMAFERGPGAPTPFA